MVALKSRKLLSVVAPFAILLGWTTSAVGSYSKPKVVSFSPFRSSVEASIVKEFKVVDKKVYDEVVQEFPDLSGYIKIKAKRVKRLPLKGLNAFVKPIEYLGYAVGKDGLLAVLTDGEKRRFVTEGDVFDGYRVIKVTKGYVLLEKGGKTYKILRKSEKTNKQLKKSADAIQGGGKFDLPSFNGKEEEGTRITPTEE